MVWWPSQAPREGRLARLFKLIERLPTSIKGSLRVAVAVTAVSAVALATHPLSDDPDEASTILRGGEWATVTAGAIPYSTIGEGGFSAAAQVSATVVGGFAALGFTSFIGLQWVLAFVMGAFAFVSYVFSSWLRLKKELPAISAGTFIIVTFAIYQQVLPAIWRTVTRVVGISVGVVAAMLTSIIVLPNPTTDQVIRRLQIAIAALERMNCIVWQVGSEGTAVNGSDAGRGEAACNDQNGERSGGHQIPDVLVHPANHVPVLLKSRRERTSLVTDPEPWHDASAEMHDALLAVKKLAPATQTELYLFSLLGFRFYLPLPLRVTMLWHARKQLPENCVYHTRKHVQHASRLLWVVFHLFENGFASEMDQKWGSEYPARVLASLRDSLTAALSDLAAAFPHGRCTDRGEAWIPDANVRAFAKAVKGIGDTSARGHDPAAAASARGYIERNQAQRRMLYVFRSSIDGRPSGGAVVPGAAGGSSMDGRPPDTAVVLDDGRQCQPSCGSSGMQAAPSTAEAALRAPPGPRVEAANLQHQQRQLQQQQRQAQCSKGARVPAAPESLVCGEPGPCTQQPVQPSASTNHGVVDPLEDALISYHRMFTFQRLMEQLLNEVVGILNSGNEVISGWPGAELWNQQPPRLNIDLDE